MIWSSNIRRTLLIAGALLISATSAAVAEKRIPNPNTHLPELRRSGVPEAGATTTSEVGLPFVPGFAVDNVDPLLNQPAIRLAFSCEVYIDPVTGHTMMKFTNIGYGTIYEGTKMRFTYPNGNNAFWYFIEPLKPGESFIYNESAENDPHLPSPGPCTNEKLELV